MLWEIDFSWEGFSWISNDDYKQSVISFRRIDKSGQEIIIICNFQPVLRENYRIGAPLEGIYYEVFNSDDKKFGGSGVCIRGIFHHSAKMAWSNSIPRSVRFKPSLRGGLFLRQSQRFRFFAVKPPLAIWEGSRYNNAY